MLLQRHRKIVETRTIAAGAEEVVIGEGGIRDGAQRVHAGVADGRGRQAVVEVGVVRRVEIEIEGGERIRPPVPVEADGVLDGGVALQAPA